MDVEPEKLALQVVFEYDKTKRWIFHVQKEDKLTTVFTPLEKIMGGTYLITLFIFSLHYSP